MKSFKTFITEAKVGVNSHLSHIEDLILYQGVKGTRNGITALRDLRDMLSGNTSKSTSVTVKWDGAPALFCGLDPEDGKFFVAKKGIFNKNPKIYKTPQDVDDDIPNPDLNNKMKVALVELKKLGIKQVVQGDVMFTSDDLKIETIDGVKYVVFHPNTIAYAIPADSDLGKQILAAKIGIVFHTEYNGDSIENLKASFGANIKGFKKTRGTWFASADIPDLSGKVTMSAKETAAVTKRLSNAGKIFQKISSSVLKDIETIPNLAQTIETYNNRSVRANQRIIDTRKHVDGLVEYVSEKFEKEIDKLKSDKGKARKQVAKDDFMKFFSDSNKRNLKLVFDLQKELVEAKILLIEKLSDINNINKFVKTKDGYKVTGDEGFVAIDRLSGGAVKLVDRMEFSTNNFSADIIKGWMSDTRN
jgi:hypothetical protein